ncbi:MAG: DUF1036 domain-containing protein, partial [Beijerinckiaceae bacterium]
MQAALAASLYFACASGASADLRLCNNSSQRVSVALSYTDGQQWITEGWWNLKAGACETLLHNTL